MWTIEYKILPRAILYILWGNYLKTRAFINEANGLTCSTPAYQLEIERLQHLRALNALRGVLCVHVYCI